MSYFRSTLLARIVLDSFAWFVGLLFGTWVRYDLQWESVELRGVLGFVGLAIVLQLLTGFVFGLYRGRFVFGSFDEVAAIALTAGTSTVALFLIDFALPVRAVPLSATLGGGIAAFVLIGGARYLWRLRLAQAMRPSGEGLGRLIVFGAGRGGLQVITAMLQDSDSPYVPVALLDDARTKRRLRVMGVRVEGNRTSIAAVAERRHADGLLIAIPSATGDLISEVTKLAEDVGLKVTVLPPVAELLGSGVSLRDIRPVNEADLLGRRTIDTDVASIAGYLRGKRVLITGAGGSIGSELCRQILSFQPSSLIMFDRDESALLNLQLSIDGSGRLDSDELVLGDLRDPDCIRSLFEEHAPHVVFHAAALKHVPLLERHPAEAIRTNVWGTLTLLEAAANHGVERFVNISTDKAADPINVLGYSKRICERLTAYFASQAGGTFLSVRFGNVLGSRGSMLDTFKTQIASRSHVTVTDPEVTRFLMTIEEAVQLVIQAGAVGRDGEVLVLDMGDPVRIVDVARRLISQSDRPVSIEYTGLRLGEKLHEKLFGSDELDYRPVHELIAHIAVPALRPDDALSIDPRDPRGHLVAQLETLCVSRARVARSRQEQSDGRGHVRGQSSLSKAPRRLA